MGYYTCVISFRYDSMQMRSETWGHVALLSPATLAMEIAEEQGEIAMLRCRHGRKAARTRTSLCGFLPVTGELILNPNTLQDLADIFETQVDLVFA